MIIITDASDEIIAMCLENTNANPQVYITPASSDHKMYQVTDVPEEITNLDNPTQFHRAITKHFKSVDVNVRLTNAQEHFHFVSTLSSEQKKEG